MLRAKPYASAGHCWGVRDNSWLRSMLSVDGPVKVFPERQVFVTVGRSNVFFNSFLAVKCFTVVEALQAPTAV